MKKRLSEIKELFNLEKLKNDRRIIVFSVCILIATTLWFLNALSKNYSTTLSYPVKYINPPKNQYLSNNPPSKFELKVEAYGFTLLRHKLAFSFSPILLNLTTIKQNSESGGPTYSVRTEELVRQISDQVSKEIRITDVNPKIITLVIDSLITKRISVKPNVTVKPKPQYFLGDSVRVQPETIEITGPAAFLDTIRFLETEMKNFDEVDKDIEQVVSVMNPKNTTVSPDKVILRIPVEKFTEKKIKIPVRVNADLENAQIKLFPSEITVSFLVSLNDYKKITENDFTAVVNYYPGMSDKEMLEVSIESAPPDIQMMRVSPDKVEFLIETN